ncbi:MAG TPA: LysM peptidoglycan-binding domain-containing protein, partial [Cytophagales bacterium]|nr:LysM peptidoglycan-binding domain-containing protein [Cytophagales bacterium]
TQDTKRKPEETSKKEDLNKDVSASPTASSNEHIVVEGDTYYSLSRKYNVKVSELQALNSNATLKIGQKIIINSQKVDGVKAKDEKISDAVLFEESQKPIEQSSIVKPAKPAAEQNTADRSHEMLLTSEPNKSEVAKNKDTEVKVEKHSDKTIVAAVDTRIPAVEPITYDNAVKRILIIPFDPYLYFSDADMEISKQSKMEHTKVRQAFRRRLNALLEPQGYETIHLLGGRIKDSLTDLNRIYKSVSYNYQEALYNPSAQLQRTQMEEGHLKEADKTHVAKETNDPLGNSRASLAKDESKYYGVKVSDPNFFPYFNSKYKIDYYIFVNQFEVKTNYATCLDRTTKNYERNFITHFSIFDNTGKQISGNRIKIHYESNENNIQKILTDNMQKVATQIIGELPKQ